MSCARIVSKFSTTIATTAATRTSARWNVRRGINLQPYNLTPGPFPSGKGSRKWRGPAPKNPSNRGEAPHLCLNTGCRAQPCRRKRETHRGFHIKLSDFPFPLRALLLSILALLASCGQVHEQMFTLDCAVGRAPLAGELAPGTAMALDVSTSPVPLLFAPHRIVARCDSAGIVTMNIETPVDTGLSQLSTPLSTAASHITYAP